MDQTNDFDGVLECVSGGLSSFNIIYFSNVLLGMLSGALILYCINYLTINPDYTCIKVGATERTACAKKDICTAIPGEINKDVKYEIDWSSDKSIHNWI